MRHLLAIGCALLALAIAPRARAFCGFYVSDADQKLYANATMVVLMREGDRTVLSMQNNYQGPPEQFAMVVPVPQVLRKENVRTLPRDVFDKVDRLASPRLVEYWEQDPCRPALGEGGFGMGRGRLGGVGGGGSGGVETVRVEARFEVGEYGIVILGAGDSAGLDTWLRQQGYHIPDGAEPALRPYVQSGMKFFVAKVDPKKVKFEGGQATLSPLRFFYDTDRFTLPVRLGLLNSAGTQDLLVHILAKRHRYEVANYPNVTIPTNLDVDESARGRFPEFYAALFDATVAKNPRAVVTEYSWSSGTCDPCPSPPLEAANIATLGEDVLGGNDGGVITSVQSGPMSAVIKQGNVVVTGALPPEVITRIVRQNFGRFRLCYENALRTTPSVAGTVDVHFTIARDGSVAKAESGASTTFTDPNFVACVTRGFGNLSFPEPEKGIVSVVYPIAFSAVAGSSSRGVYARGSDVVLTRLHVRYGKDSLGEDLVFRPADAIAGGRERRDDKGALEHGATTDGANNFQARYAIRHPWTGSIACETPRRGIWGGPPNGDTPPPVAAQKLAFAPRGSLQLGAMLRQPVPELSLAGTAPAASPGGTAAREPAGSGGAAPPATGPASAAPGPTPTGERPTRSMCSTNPEVPGSEGPTLVAMLSAALLGVAYGRRITSERARPFPLRARGRRAGGSARTAARRTGSTR